MGAGGLRMVARGPEAGTVMWWHRQRDGTMVPGWLVAEHDVGREGGMAAGKVMQLLFGYQYTLFERSEVWVNQYDLFARVDGDLMQSVIVRALVEQDADVVIECWPGAEAA